MKLRILALFPVVALALTFLVGFPARAESQTVAIRLVVTDPSGTPIGQAEIGEPVQLRGLVTDLRTPAEGVFAAYLDITYDPSLVSVAGPISFAAPYVNGTAGDTSIPGLIDEVGAFDGFTPLGGAEFLLFTVPFTVSGPGTTVFTAEPADVLPDHDILLFGAVEPVPSSSVDFGTVSLSSAIFADGFEAGDTAAWSASGP